MLSVLKYKLDIINKNFPNIIYGGCGIFSWTLSNILTIKGISNSIVYVLEINTPIGAYRCDVKFQHFFVCVNSGGINYYIDNNGIYLYESIIKVYNAPIYEIGINKLYSMLEDKRLWNNKFSFSNWNKLSNLMYKII